jgi:hypothetical protein
VIERAEVIKDPQAVHAFGWISGFVNRHTLTVAGTGAALFAFGLGTIIVERRDAVLISFAWLVLLIALVVLFEVIWPYLTIRGPVVEISPDGVLDRRILKAPVPWRDVKSVNVSKVSDVEVLVRPSRFRGGKKHRLRGLWNTYGLGSGSFTIVVAPLDTRGKSLHALCRNYHKAAEHARAAAAVPALHRAERDGLQGAALYRFIEAIRDVSMYIPVFEQHHAQTLDVVEEGNGARAMHVFTDSPRFYTVTPRDYYSLMFLDDLLGSAPLYRLDAIVINPGVGPELRIGRERFGEFRELLRTRQAD